jgi:predicted metal-dependent peptidase
MAKLSALQNLMRARMAILNHDTWRPYRGALMYGRFEVKADCPTAYTNGADSFFGEEFANSLNDAQLRYLVLHENEHKVQKHLSMYAHVLEHDKDHMTLNKAMDFAVNIRLEDIDAGEGFIQRPTPDLCIDGKYRGWSVMRIYEDLRQNQPPRGKPAGNGEAYGKGEADGGLDAHGFEESEAKSAEEREGEGREIDRIIRQGGVFSPKGSADAKRLLEGLLEPSVNWREETAEFVKACTSGRDDASWSKINRRFVYQGLYLPSTISETIGHMILGIDASGSTWCGTQLEGFVTEVVALAKECQPESIDLLWWDTAVTSVQTFKPEDYDSMLSKLSIVGGGGTRPSCVTEWLEKPEQKIKEYCAAIMLSDGQVGNDWGGSWPCPVLWCLNTRGITAGTGKTLYIEDTSR